MKKILFFLLIVMFPISALADDHRPYLSIDDLPNAVNYLPAPPAADSQRFFNDWSLYIWGKSMRETPRGIQAKSDAELTAANLSGIFSQAMGIEISAQKTPALYDLIGRTMDTASSATRKAKKHHLRTRPYAQFREPSLIPEAEAKHNPNFSYPSGHSTVGWSVALVLVEVCPEAQDAILARGYEFGQSRVIAGYHYQSDVDAGRLVAGATVARLHADPEFVAAVSKAKAEIKNAKSASQNARPEHQQR